MILFKKLLVYVLIINEVSINNTGMIFGKNIANKIRNGEITWIGMRRVEWTATHSAKELPTEIKKVLDEGIKNAKLLQSLDIYIYCGKIYHTKNSYDIPLDSTKYYNTFALGKTVYSSNHIIDKTSEELCVTDFVLQIDKNALDQNRCPVCGKNLSEESSGFWIVKKYKLYCKHCEVVF